MNSQLRFSPDNMGVVSDEHEEMFEEDVVEMEKGYSGKRNETNVSWLLLDSYTGGNRRDKCQQNDFIMTDNIYFLPKKVKIITVSCFYCFAELLVNILFFHLILNIYYIKNVFLKTSTW